MPELGSEFDAESSGAVNSQGEFELRRINRKELSSQDSMCLAMLFGLALLSLKTLAEGLSDSLDWTKRRVKAFIATTSRQALGTEEMARCCEMIGAGQVTSMEAK